MCRPEDFPPYEPDLKTLQASTTFSPSRLHGQFDASPADEKKHDKECPCLSNNGLAALAAAMTDLFPAVQRDWWPFTPEQAAAAILGERGVFLPDGDCGHTYPACCEYACYEDPGCACEACTIATLRAALDGLVAAAADFLADWDGFDDVRPSRTGDALRTALAALATAKETP